MPKIAQELGFADQSSLRKILRNPKRTTTNDRLERLRAMLGKASGPAASKAVTSKTVASKTTPKTATRLAAKATSGNNQDEWVSKSQSQEFLDRVKQLRNGGWTVDAMAPKIGYLHGRSLWKALASGNFRRRTFDALMALPASRPDGISAAASRNSTKTKTASVSRPAVSGKPAAGKRGAKTLHGATIHLESARRYLQQAQQEVQQAGTASLLLEPGLRGIMSEIETISHRLNLS
jgi:hypothetical protein